MLVAQLSLVLLVIFVIDAAIAVWRRGDRREALVVGGSIVFFVVIASAQAVAITWGIIPMPLTASLFYQCLVGAMAYELGYDLLQAAALARRLQTTEAVLHEGEKQMSLAAAAAGLIVWTWDIPRDEVWLSDNDRAFFGFSLNEKLNAERVRSIVHPEDRQSVRELVRKSLVTDKDLEAEYRLLLPDGKVRWVTRRGGIEFDADGQPTWERGVLIDITEQKQAQELFQLATEASPSGRSWWIIKAGSH